MLMASHWFTLHISLSLTPKDVLLHLVAPGQVETKLAFNLNSPGTDIEIRLRRPHYAHTAHTQKNMKM